MSRLCRLRRERVLFALAGTLTLTGILLAVLVSGWLLVVPAAVGVNGLLFAITGDCPASLVLRRACRAPGAGR